ncbi:MAG: NAD-dependent epimerase/dehydratase family protein [Propionibacteriaceae bacterium]
MRIVVLGATGHVGSYLVPRLVQAGHEVVAASRGTREPYHADPAWESVERVALDREAADADGTTAADVLAHRPDVVIDMVCFTEASAAQLVEGLRGRVSLLAHCGTVWTHGVSTTLPMGEDDPKFPFGEYGVTKHAIERLLLAETSSGGLASTIIHPGHISGPGWPVINPVGNLDPQVWATIAAGDELAVPGDGSATMHHVHADDVAQLFQLAVEHPEQSVGQAFHAVSARALTVRGFAEGAYGWWGHETRLRPLSWDAFRARSGDHADASWEHLHRSQVCSIEKGVRRLGYAPAWSSLDAARQAVTWLATHDPAHSFPPPTSQELPALVGVSASV